MLFNWWMDGISLKGVWRCVMVKNGRLFVMICGTKRKQLLSADSLDLLEIQNVRSQSWSCIDSLCNISILTALAVRMSQRFGEGSDSIVKASWRCSGDETCLLDCPRDDNVECDHRRDAGVLCLVSLTHTIHCILSCLLLIVCSHRGNHWQLQWRRN